MHVFKLPMLCPPPTHLVPQPRASGVVSIQGNMCEIFIYNCNQLFKELVEHVQVLRLKFKYFQNLIIKHSNV